MGRSSGVAFGFAVLVALTPGCSDAGGEILYNGTQETVLILREYSGFLPAKVKARPGGRGAISNFHVPEAGFTIIAQDCTYRYDLPIPERAYWDGPGPPDIVLQLAPDFSILLLPYAAQYVLPAAEALQFQRYGYPVRPKSKNCS